MIIQAKKLLSDIGGTLQFEVERTIAGFFILSNEDLFASTVSVDLVLPKNGSREIDIYNNVELQMIQSFNAKNFKSNNSVFVDSGSQGIHYIFYVPLTMDGMSGIGMNNDEYLSVTLDSLPTTAAKHILISARETHVVNNRALECSEFAMLQGQKQKVFDLSDVSFITFAGDVLNGAVALSGANFDKMRVTYGNGNVSSYEAEEIGMEFLMDGNQISFKNDATSNRQNMEKSFPVLDVRDVREIEIISSGAATTNFYAWREIPYAPSSAVKGTRNITEPLTARKESQL